MKSAIIGTVAAVVAVGLAAVVTTSLVVSAERGDRRR